MKPYPGCREMSKTDGELLGADSATGLGRFHALSHNLQLRSSGESTEGNGRPIRKCSQNRQKTVLPLPICFERMDIKRKASVRPLQADD